MKQLFYGLIGCLVAAGSVTSCQSDFDKDYEVYQQTLAEKERVLWEFMERKGDTRFMYFDIYMNNEHIGRCEKIRIENFMVYAGPWIFYLADFSGCEYDEWDGYRVYFWR